MYELVFFLIGLLCGIILTRKKIKKNYEVTNVIYKNFK